MLQDPRFIDTETVLDQIDDLKKRLESNMDDDQLTNYFRSLLVAMALGAICSDTNRKRFLSEGAIMLGESYDIAARMLSAPDPNRLS